MDDTITIEFNRKDLTINIQEVVGTIIKYYYKSHGLNIIFKDIGYTQRILNNIIYYTNVSSCGFIKQSSYTYHLKLYMENQIRYDPTITSWTKCIFCKKRKLDKKKCDVALNCCNSKFHHRCGPENGYSGNYRCPCKALHKNHKVKLCPKPDNMIEQDCVVCLDRCNTVTECNHSICNDCTTVLYQSHGKSTKCPMCRRGLVERVKINKIMKVKLSDKITVNVLVDFMALGG